MKAEKTPLRYIVQRIMRTIFTQDRQEGVATAGGYDNTFAVADCEVRGSSCLTVIIIARSKCAVKRYRADYPRFLLVILVYSILQLLLPPFLCEAYRPCRNIINRSCRTLNNKCQS